MNHYIPEPLDTSDIKLPSYIGELIERISENIHEVWSSQRISDGWTYGEARDDINLRHPCLVPYDELPEEEKLYDRRTVTETIKYILALGYEIRKKEI